MENTETSRPVFINPQVASGQTFWNSRKAVLLAVLALIAFRTENAIRYFSLFVGHAAYNDSTRYSSAAKDQINHVVYQASILVAIIFVIWLALSLCGIRNGLNKIAAALIGGVVVLFAGADLLMTIDVIGVKADYRDLHHNLEVIDQPGVSASNQNFISISGTKYSSRWTDGDQDVTTSCAQLTAKMQHYSNWQSLGGVCRQSASVNGVTITADAQDATFQFDSEIRSLVITQTSVTDADGEDGSLSSSY